MSYLTTGATAADKQSDDSTDFVKTWLAFKNAAANKLGVYRDAKGGYLTLTGGPQPMITTSHLNATHAWLSKVAQKAIAKAQSAGRPTSAMNSALAKYNAAVAGYKGRIQSYESQHGAGSANSFQGRMPLPIVDEFMNSTTQFARDMSGAQWGAFNTATKAEMFRQALKETPGGGVIEAFMDAAVAALGGVGFLLGNLNTILKITVFGAIGFFGYQAYKKLPAKEAPPA